MEDRISNLEDRNIEMLQIAEERELRLKRNEDILWEISNSIRKCNIRIIGNPEGEEREKGAESLFKEIITENFPNLETELELQVKEANKTPNYINVKKTVSKGYISKTGKSQRQRKNIKGSKAEENNLQRNRYQAFCGFLRRNILG